MIVGATNPKTIVILVAVMPGFADPGTGHLPLQLLELGMVFPLIAVVLDSAWALVAGTARAWLARSPRRMAAIGGSGGLVMIGIGLSLVGAGRTE
jgi:threonine/homoserine/homoserine lactone efflux protein